MIAAADPLAPYDAEASGWKRRHAAHLLWRAQHGATDTEIIRAHEEGLTATLERLLTPQPETSDFAAADATLAQLAADSGDIGDLKAWWAHRIVRTANPLVEKLTLFWHNHFATSNTKVDSVPRMTAQNSTLRTHALGSFRELLGAMARDVAMLVWLDCNANRRRQPNENFARELLELFALGVGNYTERDIQEAARAFTGWHVRQEKFWFNARQHDEGVKQVFGASGNFDGGEIIELCLAQPSCARFLATKLMRQFVMPSPPDEAIDALATKLREHDYQFVPALRTLFSSQLFFSAAAERAVIKSPADLVLGALRTLEARANLRPAVQLMAELGQNLFEPPTVKGWEGGRLWINSASMLKRANFATDLAFSDRYGTIADPAELAASRNWRRIDEMLQHYVELLWSADAGESLPLLERAMNETRGTLSQRLRSVIHLILAAPRYQLM
jgi:uncharacterized protein (DUF1800 family)